MEPAASAQPAPARPAPWREVFAGARGRLTTGLLVLEAVAAIEILVVATILPAVREDLGNVQLYGWTFTAHSLAAFAAIPVAGRAIDRRGARPTLIVLLLLYGGGLAMAALAPSMMVLVAGRFVQGVGTGGLYAVSLSSVAKTYPDRLRSRVLALLASMWILPGVIGPPIGTLLAETVGWRWAFGLPIPIVAAASLLVLPALRNVPVEPDVAALPLRWPIQLMLGAGLVLGVLVEPAWWSLPLIAIGLLIAMPALLRIVPSGTLRARPGLGAAAAAAFLLSAAFLAVDGFLTLMLTGIRGLSVGEAGIVITFATFAWAGGSWWQSRKTERWSPSKLVLLGTLFLGVGAVAVLATLIDAVPVVTAYVGWTIACGGMGIAFPTIPFAVMGETDEAAELSSVLLMDVLGVGIGAGLGGASVAIARAGGYGLRAGLAGAFTIGILLTGLLAIVAPRLPGRVRDRWSRVGPARG